MLRVLSAERHSLCSEARVLLQLCVWRGLAPASVLRCLTASEFSTKLGHRCCFQIPALCLHLSTHLSSHTYPDLFPWEDICVGSFLFIYDSDARGGCLILSSDSGITVRPVRWLLGVCVVTSQAVLPGELPAANTSCTPVPGYCL